MKLGLFFSLLALVAGCSAGSSTLNAPLDAGADGADGALKAIDGGHDAAVTHADAAHDATVAGCVPGQQSGCLCAGDVSGVEVCAANGSGYGSCECPDAATTVDAGRRDAKAEHDAKKERDAKIEHDARSEHDARADVSGRTCTPGDQSACACAGGASGVQVCAASGKSYGPCECSDAGHTPDARHDAPHDGGSPGTGCSIGGVAYASHAVNPNNPCESCQPAASNSGWTTIDGLNAACPAGDVCSGTCQAGCWIGGAFYASGATANDGCEVCTPSASTTSWTSVSGVGDCPAGVCNGGSCESGCLIGGVFHAPGASMDGGCELCTPASNATGWTDEPNGTDCGNGQVCSSGLCGTQCDIGGAIVTSGAANPSNPCQSCQPGTSTTAWTSADGVNAACPGGDVCAGSPASCAPGCFLDGVVVAATALNPSNACESCQPAGTGGTTAWTDTDGLNASCPSGKVCNGNPASCASGCYIAGSFYAAHATANNGCEECSPGTSTSSWTNVSGVASCPSGEVCQAGACASGCLIAGTFYASGATSNSGCEVCTPSSSATTWTNASNGTTCGGGQVCSGGACGTQCDITGSGIVSSGSVNPSDPCETCQPGSSTTQWTSTDGVNAACGAGSVCNGSPASCVSGCWVEGAFLSPGASNPVDPCETCQPGGAGGTTGWTDTDGVNASCPSGEVCNGSPATCQSGCIIAGTFYPPNATANNGCEVCAPATSTTSWSNASGAASCPTGNVCQAGSCVSGCLIGGAFYSPGASTNDGCELCVPASSTSDWTNATDGTNCGNGQVCSSGSCGTQCDIAGAGIVSSGSVNPSDPCESCQPGTSTTAWTDVDGVNAGCATGDVCSGTPASCAPGCWIAGGFVAASGVNPSDPCESCQPGGSGGTTAWTDTDGSNASCPAGDVCNGTPANCVSGCYIAGTYYAANATMNNGCEVCSPPSSTTAWQDVTGAASCPAAEVCNAGDCASGCFIDGVFYAANATANSGCEVCSPGSSTSAWTDVSGVASCPGGETCSAGSCVAFDAGVDSGVDSGVDAGVDSGTDAGCTLPAPGANGGTLQFAENFGNTGAIQDPVVALDPNSGDIVVAAGLLQGSVNFGGGLLTGSNGYDAVLARFSGSGVVKWSKDFGDGMEVGANSVAVDGSGNVVVAGVFQGSVGFGGPTLTAVGNTDIFVAEFDSSGTYLWSASFGAAGSYQGLDTVAVDPAGNVLIAGQGNSVNFGGTSLTGYYIAKFGSSGAHAWSEAFTASCDESSPTVAVDGQANVILAGCFVGSVDFGGGTMSTPNFSPFLAKFDSTGAFLWATAPTMGAQTSAATQAVAVDNCGNILVTGNFSGSTTHAGLINFGAGTLTTASNLLASYAFLAKLDPSGGAVWSEQFDNPTSMGALNAGTIAVDGEGGPTVWYGLTGSVDFGGGTLTSPGPTNVAVASFDAAGNHRWAYVAGGASTADQAGATGLAATASSVVVVGSFGTCTGSCSTSPHGTTLVLAGATLSAESADDLFIAGFTP